MPSSIKGGKFIALIISALFIAPLILGGFFIFANTVQAQITPTIHSTQAGGNWTNTSTWQEGIVPTDTDSVEINGLVIITSSTTTVANIIIADNGTLRTQAPYQSQVLVINQDIENHGVIINLNWSRLILEVHGDILNNGSWNNYQTILTGDQVKQIITINPIKSSIFLDGNITLTTDASLSGLSLNNFILDIGNHTLTVHHITTPGTIQGSGDLELSGSITADLVAHVNEVRLADGATIYGNIETNKLIFQPGRQLIRAVITCPDVIFQGPGHKIIAADNAWINGNLTIESEAILYTNYSNQTLTLSGDLINYGIVDDWNYRRIIFNIAGNITNQGGWSSFKTNIVWDEVPGATGYQLRLTQDRDNWPDPIELNEAKYNIAALINLEYYWQTRANLNGTYTDWSEIKWINGTDEEELEPVILIPGIIASYLNRDGPDKDEIWPNMIKMSMPGDDSYLNELILQQDGYPDADIFASDILRQILFKEYWQGLIEELESEGYIEDVNMFVFPYDWRLDIDWIAGDPPVPEVANLKDEIGLIKSQTGAQKVNIIAHSMGGLVAKRYMVKYGSQSVNKFIDIATPHLGAPKAFKILEYGDDLGFNFTGYSILNTDRVKIITQNMPSIYQLLPSRKYFTQADPDYGSYIADIYDLDDNQIQGNLDFDQSLEFMENTGRNALLLGTNDTLHSTIDNYIPQFDGIDTYNIIGCGRATVGKIYVLNKEKTGEYEYGLKYINGDSTVPLGSAEAMFSTNKAYLKNITHAEIPSADGIKELVTSILRDEQDNFDFSNYSDLNQDNTICSFSGTQISFHSPMALHVYDQNNNHLGPDENGDIEFGIPGAEYDIIENNKFVFLPLGNDYTVTGQAESQGQFNVRIQNIVNGQYIQTVYYNQIPIETADTNIEISLDTYTMQIDQDGDHIFEIQLEPDSILDQAESADTTKPETTINITGDKNVNDEYISHIQIELIAEDNQDGSGILIIEYSLDNQNTWQEYLEPIVLDEDGGYTIFYMSTDRAGNVEVVKQSDFMINKITINKLIQKIEQFYNEGGITKKWVEDSLIRRLQRIQKHIGFHEEKLEKRERQLARAMERCLKKKDQAYCDKKVAEPFNKKTEKLNQINQKNIQLQYNLILKKLKLYNDKKWIDDEVYGIIKSDIEYLKTN